MATPTCTASLGSEAVVDPEAVQLGDLAGRERGGLEQQHRGQEALAPRLRFSVLLRRARRAARDMSTCGREVVVGDLALRARHQRARSRAASRRRRSCRRCGAAVRRRPRRFGRGRRAAPRRLDVGPGDRAARAACPRRRRQVDAERARCSRCVRPATGADSPSPGCGARPAIGRRSGRPADRDGVGGPCRRSRGECRRRCSTPPRRCRGSMASGVPTGTSRPAGTSSSSIDPVLEDLDLDVGLVGVDDRDDVAAVHLVAGLAPATRRPCRPPCRRRATASGTHPPARTTSRAAATIVVGLRQRGVLEVLGVGHRHLGAAHARDRARRARRRRPP